MRVKTLLFFIASLCLPLYADANTPNVAVIAYWTDWGIYPPVILPTAISGSYQTDCQTVVNNPISDAQLDLINILNYAFLEIDTNGNLYFWDPSADLQASDSNFCQSNPSFCARSASCCGNFSALIKAKDLHGNLKVQISIGGAGHGDTFDSAFKNTTPFINSLKTLIAHYPIDGIDLDFEPGPGNFNATNAANLVALAQAIHQALPDFIITMAGPANPKDVADFNDGANNNWQKLAASINYIEIMAYDMHNAQDGSNLTGLQSELYISPDEPVAPGFNGNFSADQAVQAYLSVGVPSQQIVVGVPAQARTVSGVSSDTNNGLYQNFSGYPSGDLGPGLESYYQIATNWISSGGFSPFTQSVNGELSGAWVYNPTTQIFGSYDSPAVIDSKINYVKAHNLGGMMMWELRGDIDPSNPDSLLNHMGNGLK